MTVRIYRSTDTSAPVLTGQVGSLTALLDAVLVNGYGTQLAAGWSIAYTTTNKRAYQQNPTGANLPGGAFLYVDDTGPGAGGAREARWCGFETMSAITPTGTGQFPTAGQTGIGFGAIVCRKSSTADTTARNWVCVANGQTVYLFVETGDVTIPVGTFSLIFGDFFSYRSGDQYAIAAVGRIFENTNNVNVETFPALISGQSTLLQTSCIGHYCCRSWTGIGGSVQFGCHVDQAKMGEWGGSAVQTGNVVGNGQYAIGNNSNSPTSFPYPNGPDGACWVSPVWIHHNSSVHGYFKGLWAPLHHQPLNHGDTYTVSGGNLNGKSFVVQSMGSNPGNAQIHIETSDTWS